jgi:hypothetical protein
MLARCICFLGNVHASQPEAEHAVVIVAASPRRSSAEHAAVNVASLAHRRTHQRSPIVTVFRAWQAIRAIRDRDGVRSGGLKRVSASLKWDSRCNARLPMPVEHMGPEGSWTSVNVHLGVRNWREVGVGIKERQSGWDGLVLLRRRCTLIDWKKLEP